MERLWAPWRGELVSGTSDSDECFLCRILGEVEQDEENYVLLRGRRVFTILNRYPYNSGHLLVVPNRHIAELHQLSEDEIVELFSQANRAVAALKDAYRPQGFNLGINLGKAAGAGVVGHLHLHIVPRWDGDTNFMPVLGAAKVLPHSLEAVCNLLKSCIASTP